jgi:hypothetical protein
MPSFAVGTSSMFVPWGVRLSSMEMRASELEEEEEEEEEEEQLIKINMKKNWRKNIGHKWGQ